MAHCPNCGGELKIIAAILERPVIEKILTHLGLEARAPPQFRQCAMSISGGLRKVARRERSRRPAVRRAGGLAVRPSSCVFRGLTAAAMWVIPLLRIRPPAPNPRRLP